MTYTVYSLRDLDHTPKYFGSTKTNIKKRLQDMLAGARAVNSNQYSQPISVWLREMYAEFKTPIYTIEGTFETKEEAKEMRDRLIATNPSVLNLYFKPLTALKFYDGK